MTFHVERYVPYGVRYFHGRMVDFGLLCNHIGGHGLTFSTVEIISTPVEKHLPQSYNQHPHPSALPDKEGCYYSSGEEEGGEGGFYEGHAVISFLERWRVSGVA